MLRALLCCCLTLTVTSAQDAPSDPGLMPKAETGALEFLRQHPEWDGRGITVAIFDSGVDPSAPALQKTSDGRPKVVDIVDATGSGDVRMVDAAPENGEVKGLSGRTLKLNPDWKIRNGRIRIGMKPGYELFPREVVGRMKRHNRKHFLNKHRQLEVKLREAIDGRVQAKGVSTAELRDRLAALQHAMKAYSDPGPVYDCIVFHDGGQWRAAIDTDEDGDFSNEQTLMAFRRAQQHAQFDEESQVSFGVNFYDDGRVLSIVTESNDHGTHVAGIVAGNDEEHPQWNGVAPGAQIVSVKIGDTYLDGMESGVALMRAADAVLRNECSLINMSYGEPTKRPNGGILIRQLDQLVRQHNVIFIGSAGNAGPALSTVGAPGGTTSSLIGVGAYVSPQMARAQYAMTESKELPYTWTSHGPTFDGDLGVDLFAPGGAWATVPRWTLNRSKQKNGTSMASPNCCGNFALLLSAIKANGHSFTPIAVRRAFENTARSVKPLTTWAQGKGLIQTPQAWAAFVRDREKPSQNVILEATDGAGRRGVYLREDHQTSSDAVPTVTRFRVRPSFNDAVTNAEKTGWRIRLKLHASKSWIRCGEEITINSSGTSLNVTVDTRDLEPGAHFGEVTGLAFDDPERGPLFRIPVTVTKSIEHYDTSRLELSFRSYEAPAEEMLPEETGDEDPVYADGETNEEQEAAASLIEPFIPERLISGETPEELSLDIIGGLTIKPSFVDGRMVDEVEVPPGTILRRFLRVPDGASWVRVRLGAQSSDDGDTRRFVVHGVQVIPGLTNRDAEQRSYVTLKNGQTRDVSFPVHAGRTLELALASYWSNSAECSLDYEVEFFGIESSVELLSLTPDRAVVPVTLHSAGFDVRVSPEIKLTAVRSQHVPVSSTIRQCPSDRTGADGRLHELTISWSLDVQRSGSIVPHFAATDDLLYGSDLGGAVWSLYEADGRRTATDDIWCDPMSVSAGSYTLKLTVFNTDRSRLERIQSRPLVLERRLSSSVTVPVYSSPTAAGEGGTRLSSASILAGERKTVWVGQPSGYPSDVKPGEILVGTVTWGECLSDGESLRRPAGFPVSVVVPGTPAPSRTSGPASFQSFDESKSVKGRREYERRVSVAAREARLQLIAEFQVDTQREQFEKQIELLLRKNENDLTVLALRLHRLDHVQWRKQHLPDVVEAADAVLSELDQDEIALTLARRSKSDDPSFAAGRRRAVQLRALLIDTLYRKARAIGYQELPEVLERHPINDQSAFDEQFEAAYQAFCEWVDPTEKDYFLLYLRHEGRRGNAGGALKVLNRHASDRNYWHLEKRRKLYHQLGWTDLESNAWHWRTVRFPGGKP